MIDLDIKRTSNFHPHSVTRTDLADGSILLRSNLELGPVANRTGDWLHRWAKEAPDRLFLAERSGAGWREESYRGTLQKVRALAASLLARGLNGDTPVVVLSGNGLDHGLLALACQYIGVPIVPLAEQYSLIPHAHDRLVEVLKLIKPNLAYVIDAGQFAPALALEVLNGIEIVASRPGATSATPFEALLKGDGAVAVDAAFASVGPETVAKILMTSGSTSTPKGVLTTHRMMCVNQAQLAAALPFLGERPHRVVDWLPWNHVFGGSHNFNMMLANGGSFYIDDGKPLKEAFSRTAENLGLMTGTLVFNVPVGFAMLLQLLKQDQGLRRRFFADLDLIFYAGASLPQDIWEGFEAMATEIKGEVPLMTSSWGLTETAPAVLLQQEPTASSGVVGVPLPGTEVKLIPNDIGSYEIRAKGPNVMQGYFQNDEKTRESFDAENYFITGDAMMFVDDANMNAGLRFVGRISEDFKLLTGTWVRATQLRVDLLAALAPLAADVVVTGHDRDEVGVLIFPNNEALGAAGYKMSQKGGALSCAGLLEDVRRRLLKHAGNSSGSASRVSRALVLADPPSLADGEITAKGNLNFKKVLERRAELLARLYADHEPYMVRI